MHTYEKLASKLTSLDGVSKLFAKRELKELPNILWDDEDVENAIAGRYEKKQGLLVATNKRLVFVEKECSGSGSRIFPTTK